MEEMKLNPQVVDYPTFLARIQNAFEASRLQTKEVAARAGVSQSYISRLLKGDLKPGWDFAASIALALGGTPNDFQLVDYDAAPNEFNERQRRAFARLVKAMQNQERHFPGSVAIIARSMEEQTQAMIDAFAKDLPAGTSIAHPEPGVKTYDPPPSQTDESEENDGADQAGEPPAGYPKKKATRKKGRKRNK